MLKKLIAGIVVSAVLGTGGLVVAGAVASPDSGSTSTTAAPGDATAHRGHLGKGARALRAAAQIAADTIGISLSDLRDGVKSGKTVAELAQTHNVDPQSVVDAIVKAGNARIDQAVADGKLDADRAAKLKERLPKLADAFVNHTQNVVRRIRHAVRRRHRAFEALKVAADTIGIETDALVSELKAGKSVAEVAAAHGVSTDTVVDAIVADVTQRIDAAVAAGKLDATAAARIKAGLRDRIVQLVNGHPRFGVGRDRRAGAASAAADATA